LNARIYQVTEITVGDYLFHVRKFRALPASRISGDVVALLAPLLGSAGSLLDGVDVNARKGGDSGKGEDSGLLDQDLGTFLPALADALAKLEGKKLERLLLELLIDEGCITFDGDLLTQAVLDDLFCGDLMGLLKLAVEVIKLNFASLFTMLGSQFGSRVEAVKNLI